MYDQNFYWGQGWLEGRGNSERCLKWGGGGGRSSRNLSKNILKLGWLKAKVVCRGGV